VVNNGADITAPVDIAAGMATKLNALIAPVIPYGVTGSPIATLTFAISEADRAYVGDVLDGLARRTSTIIVVNGHGGPQTDPEQPAEAASRNTACASWSRPGRLFDITLSSAKTVATFWNETAMIQAIDPKLVKQERLRRLGPTPRAEAPGRPPFPVRSSSSAGARL
jgi:creatinine amidohydrolase/Fe(II)-dependent formamide hydrolase-like protein